MPSTQTGLAPGTEVCIKASTGTTIVFVDDGGFITNSAITNRNGIAQGISYYAFGDSYEPPCDPYEPYSPCDAGVLIARRAR